MDRKSRVLVAAAIGLLVLALILYVHGIHLVDPRSLGQEITGKLPPGTDQSQVIAFLDSRRISHSEYVPQYHQIQAEIGKSRIGLGGGRIIIKFYFDDRGKLLSHTVRELLDFL